MSIEVLVPEGDEAQSISQELGQGQRRHHAHAAKDDEPSRKRSDMKVKILQARMNKF